MRDLARSEESTGARVVEKALDFEARTELGRKLMLLRKEIERSGEPLLDWDDLEREIAERRGERNP